MVPEQFIRDHAQNILPKRSIPALFKIQNYFQKNSFKWSSLVY